MFSDQIILTLLFPSRRITRMKDPAPSKQLYNAKDTLLPYKELDIIKLLNQARFPVYLACSKVNKQQYAIKIFPLENQELNRHFLNEIRFAFLDHPNVIKILYVEKKKSTVRKESISYITMEYAPYGDFFDLIVKIKLQNYDKLIRTYFRQLIQGIEYLHSQGVGHLDLKPENLLLGENYILKIADFDLSCMAGDDHIISEGTKCYRAPEVIKGNCVNCKAADIYSAGVILFLMKSGGLRPHCEDCMSNGFNFFKLLYHSQERFWKEHSKFQPDNFDQRFTPEVKELFVAMTKYNPRERITIEEVKTSRWYKGEVYNNEELIEVMEFLLKSNQD